MATRIIIENLILDDDPHTVENWIERLDQAIDIAIFNSEDKLPTDAGLKTAKINTIKRSYLLSSLGPVSYKLLKSYCCPAKPETKTYDELTKLLKDKLSPKTNKVSEQYRFNLLKQGSSESISLYMARIKEAATTCGFAEQYDVMVRNRFISGLSSEKIRTALLSDATDDTTSDTMLEKALSKEQASQSNSAMTSVSFVRTVNFNSPGSSRGARSSAPYSSQKSNSTVVCEQCTLRGHSKANCYTKCRYCKQKGHIAKSCPKLRGKGNRSHHVENEEELVEPETGLSQDFGFNYDNDNNWINQVDTRASSEGLLRDVGLLV